MIFMGHPIFSTAKKSDIYPIFSTAKKSDNRIFSNCENPLKSYFLNQILLILIYYSLINDIALTVIV